MVNDSAFSKMKCPNFSQNVMIVPRLGYSVDLLCEIMQILKETQTKIKKTNQFIINESDGDDMECQNAIGIEKTVTFSIEILSQIRKRTEMISDITKIPSLLPSAIPMIRTISAQLFVILPECSQKLSELSVQLGSIVLDSATLTKARFDFGLSNEESSTLLDEVKLMVDSKINKQYPNLVFSKL